MSVIWHFDPAIFFISYPFSLKSFTITSFIASVWEQASVSYSMQRYRSPVLSTNDTTNKSYECAHRGDWISSYAAVRNSCYNLCLDSARNGYPGTRITTRYPGTRWIPGYPGMSHYPKDKKFECIFRTRTIAIIDRFRNNRLMAWGA